MGAGQRQGQGHAETRVRARGGEAQEGQEETGAGLEDPERVNEEDREGERGRRAAEAQPLPPWLPQCQAGLCIPKASPETPACWSMKARRKVAKLGGSRGPAGWGGVPPGGWRWDKETPRLPSLTPPPHLLSLGTAPTPCRLWAGWGVLLQSPDSGVCWGQ